MKYWIKYLQLVIILNLISAIGYSQEVEKKPDVISFYLDCRACDFTFVRQELPFVSFVLNPQLADVHIMVTDAQTGGGGHKYFLNFIGKNEYSDFNNAYEVVSHQSDTEDDRRRVLLRYLKIGILQNYAKTGFSDNLNIDIRENENRKADDMVIDRWNNWVFNFETGGELDKEQKQNEYSLVTEVRAEKITEDWKTEIEASYEVNRENYYNGGNIITNKQASKDLWVSYVKSLTDKWSAGFLGTYSSSTFLNTENTYGTGAGIEYNFFPWKECNRRIFNGVKPVCFTS